MNTKLPNTDESSDEAKLDAEIEAQIKEANQRAEEADDSDQQKTTESQDDSSQDNSSQEDSSDESVDDSTSSESPEKGSQKTDQNQDEAGFRVPSQGHHESDAAYAKRVELAELVYQRKNAKNDDEKSQIESKMESTRADLRKLNTQNFNRQETSNNEGSSTNDDQQQKPDDVRRIVEEAIIAHSQETETRRVLSEFVNNNKQLQDPDFREVFFDFVDSDFNWQGKTPDQLNNILGLALTAMTGPVETFNDRVVKSTDAQKAVNAMNFPGGSVADQGFSKAREQQIAELEATGMSREKAIELTDPEDDE